MNKQGISPDGRLWLREAGSLANRINLHYWISSMVPKVALSLVILGIAEIFLRGEGVSERDRILLIVLTIGMIVLWSLLESRRRFCGSYDGLVRLETVLRLHNRLSAAHEGGLPWPKFRADTSIDDGYRINWREFLVKPTAALLFFIVAGWVPVHSKLKTTSTLPTELPPDLAQVQTWLDALKQEDLIDPDKLKDAQNQLDQFKDRSPSDWYTQATLEGANSLKQSTSQSLSTLSQDLDKADDALQKAMDQAAKDPATTTPEEAKSLQDELKKAADSLAMGNFPVKQDMLKQLSGAESAKDLSLTPDQLKKLEQQMAKAKAMASKLSAEGDGKGDGSGKSKLSKEMQDAMNGKGPPSERDEKRLGNSGPGPGQGLGKKSGPESSAPLELQPRDGYADGTKTTVTSDDMSHAMPGELTAVTKHAPTVDHNQTDSTVGGLAKVDGSGGDVVDKDSYEPDEADTVRKYFNEGKK